MGEGSNGGERRQPRAPARVSTRALEARNRLVLATIACIERHGVAGATVRRIVAEAGVNIAAVSYYFGSKEEMLEEVFAVTLHEAFPKALGELQAAIAAAGGDARAGTRLFLSEYLQHAFQYPRLSAAHLQPALAGDYSGPAVRELRRFLDGFLETIGPAMTATPPSERRLAVVSAWASIMQLAMLREAYDLPLREATGPAMVESVLAVLFRDG